MTQKPILYDYLFSGNCYKVRLLLSQLGIAFECRELDIIAGDTKQPWFLQKNPMGQVPVLELFDPERTCLRESNAILMHLAEGTPFLPPPGLARTRVLEWLCFEQSNIASVIGRARFRRTFPAAVATLPAEFEAWHRHGNRALNILEERLHDYASWPVTASPSPTSRSSPIRTAPIRAASACCPMPPFAPGSSESRKCRATWRSIEFRPRALRHRFPRSREISGRRPLVPAAQGEVRAGQP